MIVKIAAFTVSLAIFAPVFASARSIDDLLKDHALLNRELERCKQIGMAANDDPRCHTAWTAENRRFFGDGTDHYTPVAPRIYPDAPVPDLKPRQKAGPSPHEQR